MEQQGSPENKENRKEIHISVRNLVEFVLRSGDIDNRHSGGAQKEAMLAGGRLHRKIQKRMGAGYRAEVPLKHTVEDEEQEISLIVEGRADGIFEENGIVTIDEIKGMYMDLSRLEEPVEVHMVISTAVTMGWRESGFRSLTVIWRLRTFAGFTRTDLWRSSGSGFRV